MTENREKILERLGFRFGISGPHSARTMMLDDLRLLLALTSPTATREEYATAVVEGNVLGKPTRKARQLALRHLGVLYGLDRGNPIFRALRTLWQLEPAAQPLLALAAALARDPLLRATRTFIMGQEVGAPATRESFEAFLATEFPERFSPASVKSLAQNVAGTWTAAGFLSGHRRKARAVIQPSPEAMAMLLFLGFLEGRTGQRLFTSDWVTLASRSPEELEALASSASHRGLIVFMNAGGVKEVRFPGYLTKEEENTRLELSHVL